MISQEKVTCDSVWGFDFWQRRVPQFVGIFFLLLVAPMSEAATAGWDYMAVTRINWQLYGEKTFAAARSQGKPLFVFVYADWCQWCEKLERETLETPQIRQWLADNYMPVAVDFDRQPKLARQLGARLVPTIVLITPEGEKLSRFYGFQDAQSMADTLQQVLTAWKKGELPDKSLHEFGSEETCCPLAAPNPK